jgi:nucleoside-diphosphate-sugar epimerase
MTHLIFGCGYLGSRVAKRWRDAGETVIIVTRTPDKAIELHRQGFEAIVTDLNTLDTDLCLPTIDVLLYSVGFDRTPGQTISRVYERGLQNVLRALRISNQRVIYISTTGVYGDAAGDWIDENTLPSPQREGGRASLAAEQVLTAHPLGGNSVILRLAGLYGPGRVPFLDLLRAGQPIPAAEHGHLNLIHVDDAASVVVAASNLATFTDGLRIYCVSDGHPVQRGDYYREVARQFGAPAVRFVSPDPTSPRAARAETDRRVSNARMLKDLKVSLVYPDYRAGLAAILQQANSDM